MTLEWRMGPNRNRGAIGIAWLLALLLFSCHARAPQTDGQKPTPSPPALSPGEALLQAARVHVSAGHIVEKSRGKTVWDMKSGSATVAFGQAEGVVHAVDALLYQNGRPMVRIQAPTARVDYKASVLYLEQGVRAHAIGQPVQFTADRAQWNWTAPEGLRCERHVQFSRGGLVVSAGTLIGDVALRRVTLLRNPEALMRGAAL